VISPFLAVNQQLVQALGYRELIALYTGKGLESRSRGAPAIRAVADGGVEKFVGHAILDGTAEALSVQRANVHAA
jgi:hypothetical protein